MGLLLLTKWLPWALKFFLVLLAAAFASRRKIISEDGDNRVQIVVLGDIGRSPRMQYHALSMAKLGWAVELVGYQESNLYSEIHRTPTIKVVPLATPPSILDNGIRLPFVVLGPLKVIFQSWALFGVLLRSSKKPSWMLVQNPPSIPTLAVCLAVCLWHRTRLVIDWHNFGYSILSLKLGQRHPLVHSSRLFEACVGRFATAHICVTRAMAHALRDQSRVASRVLVLHDRPAPLFQPLDPDQRTEFLEWLSATETAGSEGADHSHMNSLQVLSAKAGCPDKGKLRREIDSIKNGNSKLVVSATSWTADEDFDMFLDALVAYSTQASRLKLPNILVVITGKGPNRAAFESKAKVLHKEGHLSYTTLVTVYFDDMQYYAKLLGSADLGVSLHTSSSGVDLPMKVLDMFGAGLPVVGWSDFEAWSELVQEDRNGTGFKSALELSDKLQTLFGGNPGLLRSLRSGALEEGKHRWDDEWMPSAGQLFAYPKNNQGDKNQC